MKNFIKINRALAAKKKKLFTLLLAVIASVSAVTAASFVGFKAQGNLGSQIDNDDLIQNKVNVVVEATNEYYNHTINLINGGEGTFTMGGVTFSFTNEEAGKIAYKIYDNYIQPNGLDREIRIPTTAGEQVTIVLEESCSGMLVDGVSTDFVCGKNVITAKGSSIILRNPVAKPKISAILSWAGTCGDNLTWDLTNGVLTISGTGAMYNYSLDSRAPWYDNRDVVTSVVVNTGVTSIGELAFRSCVGLTSIEIPNSVTSIGEGAFWFCDGLTSIEIPNSVYSIGNDAFWNCDGLTSVTIHSNYVVSYMSIKNKFGVKVKNYTIGDGVTSVGDYAFSGCTGLTSVTIGNSVTSIGEGAFYSCTSLTSVTIGNSVTSIGNQAFNGCSSLTSVTWKAKNCNWGYNFGSQVESFVFGNEVKVIPNNICSRMTKLTSILIPNSVTSIGDYAFRGCTGLTSVTIGNSVESIKQSAFSGCTGLTSVNISSNVKSLSDSAFAYCSKLAEVIIPGSVTSIGKGAFKYGNRLQKIHLGENVETIDTGAFANCPYLLEIHAKMEFPPVIDASVFEDCGDLSGIDCYVPETSMALYKKAIIWKEFQLHPMETVNVNVQASATNGIVEGAGNYEMYTNAVLTVIPNDGYIFKQWSDGNTSNPRTIYVTQDTVLNAVCEPISANALPYNEPFTANIGDFSIKDVNLGGLDYVWKWANTDYGMKASAYVNNTNHATESWLISPAISLLNATDIVLAFDHAVNKGTPDNLRVKISTDSGTSWNDLDVPNWPAGTNWSFISTSLSLDKYAGKIVKIAFVYKSTSSDCPTWEIKNFSVTGTVTPVDPLPIDVEVGETSANVTWQTVSNAYTYELIIRTVNGDVICSIIFDAEGHVQIVTNDSPSRDKASQQEQVDNCVYTITGLTGGTEYNYILIAKDNGGNEIITYSGSFRTKGSSQSIGEISVDSDKPAKILHDGKIFILRGDKAYTVTGQEVK